METLEDGGSFNKGGSEAKPWGCRMADGAARRAMEAQHKVEGGSDVGFSELTPWKVGGAGAEYSSFLQLPRRHPEKVS